MQNLVKVAIVTIQLIHEEDHRLAQLLGVTESVHRAHLGTILSIDEDDGLVSDVQGRDGTAHKVITARAVDDIELLPVPLHVEHR